METVIETYLALGEEMANALNDFISQPVLESASMMINAHILPQGRYTERAPRGAAKVKKVAPVVAVDALGDGETKFLRPNGDYYYARTWGEHQDVATLRKAREVTALAMSGKGGASMFALLYGAPGCGKTALVEAAFNGELETIIGTGDTELSDFIGGYIQTPSGGFEWVDGPLLRAAEEGKVLFIDEVGLIDPKQLAGVYGAMDGRGEIVVTANPERGTVKIHPNFYVVAATNPNAPGVRLSEALLSRFTVQAEMSTDWGLARTLGVPTTVVTVAQNLSKKQASGECSWSPQFRELLAFRDIANTFGNSFAIANLLAASPEIDRPIVADVLSRAFGEECKPARI